MILVAALALSAVLTAGGCGSSGTGLIAGTVDNSVIESAVVGQSEAEVRSALNGAPLESYPYADETTGELQGKCDYYRGVNVHVGSLDFEATGTIWRLCFRAGKLALIDHPCPIPWKPGELDQYKQAEYSADPTNCKL